MPKSLGDKGDGAPVLNSMVLALPGTILFTHCFFNVSRVTF